MNPLSQPLEDRLTISPDQFTDISYEVSDGIATVLLNRPEARNGYTIRMGHELGSAMRIAEADENVRVVILGARGDHFCVGADLSAGGFEAAEDSAEDGAPSVDSPAHPDFVEPAGRCTREMAAMNTPIIAAVQGRAVGAGGTIILPADIRIATHETRFAYLFARRGIVPEGASAWWLPKVVGHARASEWMLTGRSVSAQEAQQAGLISSLHEPEELLDAARAIAREIIENTAPVAVAVTKRMLRELAPQPSPAAAHRVDSALIVHALTSPDAVEGVMSFLEKRPPAFPGRVPTDLPEGIPWPGSE